VCYNNYRKRGEKPRRKKEVKVMYEIWMINNKTNEEMVLFGTIVSREIEKAKLDRTVWSILSIDYID
jgi:hypothetical protein